MSMSILPAESELHAKGRKLTGGMVLFMLVGFFATIIAVNMVLLGFAIKTFSGREAKNAYIAGMSHDRALAAARAQDERGWVVDAQLMRLETGRSSIRLVRRDAGAQVALDAIARFEHPADSRQDRSVALAQASDRVWSAFAEVPAGGWDMVIEMRSGKEMLFHSRERIIVKD
jgi:nitrogen fixation protein FixH